MSFFNRPHYQSDVTLFIEKLKEQKPDLERKQAQGRQLLWDKNVDAQVWQEYRAAQVAQKPYVYHPESGTENS